MTTMTPPHDHVFEQRADTFRLSNSACLNSNNASSMVLSSSDVVVVGGGIHSLIYAVHTKTKDPSTSITIFEKSSSPGYKIGESTLTTFGLWMKTIGIHAALLLRLFGLKDGLAFYFLSKEGDPDAYSEFCANGPPGDFVPTCQIERKISELLLTLYAQRMGINVFHGHAVDVDDSTLSDRVNFVQVKDIETKQPMQICSRLVVDATGRFRRFASKEARVKRFDGVSDFYV